MSVTFEQPLWLLLLLLAVPMAWAGWRWFSSMSAARRVSAVLLRVVLIALVTAMLAGASAVQRTNKLAVVAVIDVSGSMRQFARVGPGEDGRDAGAAGGTGRLETGPTGLSSLEATVRYFQRALEGRGPEDLFGAVVFDGRAAAVALPQAGDVLDRNLDIQMVEGTNIAEAIRLAMALIPPDAAGRLVLVSDGNETAGDAMEAAAEAAGRRAARAGRVAGLPIDTVPIRYEVRDEVLVEFVDAPPTAPAESTIAVRVGLRSTDGARGTLRLSRDGQPIDINPGAPGLGRPVRIPPGRHVEVIQVQLDPGRVHQFRAEFVPETVQGPDGLPMAVGDTNLQNNRGEAFTITPGRGTVLVVDGVSQADPTGPGATLPNTLREAGIDVKVVAPAGLPAGLLELQPYDLIILQNVPVEAVPAAAQRSLVAHVREMGAGLVMVGGPDSFGPGGWKGSPIEPILPVSLDLPESVIVPEVAVMFVLDNSGSMAATVMGSARSQQEIANEAAALAVQTLDRKDLVGVISFNSTWRTEAALAENDDPDRTAARIRSISPGGGTVIGPPMRAAAEALRGVEARHKHIVLLSDGVAVDADVLPDLSAGIHEDGIVVTTVAVGGMADLATMRQMAEAGGGTYYEVFNPAVLPRILARAVRIVRSPLISEVPFTPVIFPGVSPLVAGLSDPPQLGGIVLTQPREEPAIVYAMMRPDGEPLLAHWRVELGQVAAFTSDTHKWAARWLDWPGYRQMWTRIARSIARATAAHGYQLTTEVVADELRIRLEALDEQGRPLDLLTVPTAVHRPTGEPLELRLTQTGPGIYEGAAPAEQSGNYVVLATPRQGNRRLAPAIGGASVASGLEFRRLRSNEPLLYRIADATGGRVLDISAPGQADLFDRAGIEPSEARVPIWRSLLLWALIVLLLDVGTRRVAWDRFISAEFGPGWRRAAAEAVRDRSEQASRTLASLRGGGESRAARREGSAALGDEEASRLVQEQARRRREARQAAARAARQEAAAGAGFQPAESRGAGPQQARPDGDGQPKTDQPQSAPIEEEREEESGLLAAKRRARERFERENDS